MAIDLTAFVEALRDSRLLEAEQFGAVLRDVRQRPRTADDLTKELIRRGWLTEYQAEQLLQGRGKNLVLAGYVILERLSEGGMGQVYKARHAKSGRVAALKVIRPDKLAHPEALRRFHREARSLARLAHPNVVAVYEATGAAGTHFLAMEYIEGTDLARLVAQRGPLPVAEACDYIRQAALGLQHAHERGLVHRDLKPSNVLLQNGPNGSAIPKLTDFGLARIQAADDDSQATAPLTRLGAVMGTPDYMAPEQITNSSQADARSDLYSLGCTLYCLLAGHPPFAGGNLEQKLAWQLCAEPPPLDRTRRGLPAGLAAVVHKLLAKKPEDRYPSAAALAAALLPYCPTAPPPPSPRVAGRPVAGPWLLAAGVGVAAALLVIALAALLWPRPPAAEGPSLAVLPRLTNSLGMEFVEVPAGTFVMGSPEAEVPREPDEGPTHEVTLTRPFYLGVHEVTQAPYQKVMGDNPADFREGKGGGSDHPVEHVTWDRAVEFCRRLAALDAEKAAGRSYRLPTEAEWEYACRAGTTTPVAFGNGLSSKQANFDGKSPVGDGDPGPTVGKTTRAGSYPPNRFGLYDLHGNVWEWCADAYDPEFYRKSLREDPVCQSGDGRVARGGCWQVQGHECRSARRLRLPPTHDSYRVGFRVVCVVTK